MNVILSFLNWSNRPRLHPIIEEYILSSNFSTTVIQFILSVEITMLWCPLRYHLDLIGFKWVISSTMASELWAWCSIRLGKSEKKKKNSSPVYSLGYLERSK